MFVFVAPEDDDDAHTAVGSDFTGLSPAAGSVSQGERGTDVGSDFEGLSVSDAAATAVEREEAENAAVVREIAEAEARLNPYETGEKPEDLPQPWNLD